MLIDLASSALLLWETLHVRLSWSDVTCLRCVSRRLSRINRFVAVAKERAKSASSPFVDTCGSGSAFFSRDLLLDRAYVLAGFSVHP
mmetsp:Transcript_7984/g.20353  ORF Transcript_7984/g.20353 Transcript_7984/m.20353 type:complete len:87 (+) Transcript_7984:1463-1723(+)